MHAGVDILLKRMETNPDEFIDGYWDAFFQDQHIDCFEEEDRNALEEGRKKLAEYQLERQRRRFTEAVIAQITNQEAPRESDGRRVRYEWLSEQGLAKLTVVKVREEK